MRFRYLLVGVLAIGAAVRLLRRHPRGLTSRSPEVYRMNGDSSREINEPMPHTHSGSHERVTPFEVLRALFARWLGGRTPPPAIDEGIDAEAFERFQEGGLRVVGELVAGHKKRKKAIA